MKKLLFISTFTLATNAMTLNASWSIQTNEQIRTATQLTVLDTKTMNVNECSGWLTTTCHNFVDALAKNERLGQEMNKSAALLINQHFQLDTKFETFLENLNKFADIQLTLKMYEVALLTQEDKAFISKMQAQKIIRLFNSTTEKSATLEEDIVIVPKKTNNDLM